MEDFNFTVVYENELVTTAKHLYSGTELKTDAPLDNHGKASSFSPTDLVSISLASCMISVIAIQFQNRDKKLHGITTKIKKVMASNPRRIAEIWIEFDFGVNVFSKDELVSLERLAHACPVANSLSKDIIIKTNFLSSLD